MMTLSKSNGLWTGSLQKHMAVSRRQMNKSYGLQQAQLARMNIVRDSQRLQLSAADTLVRLEQLKEEIKKNQYKSPPKVETLGVIPNSNPALESTLTNSGSQTEVEEEPLEEKRALPTLEERVAARAKSAPTSRAATPEKKSKNKGGLTIEIPAKKPASPSPSVASTSFSDIVEPYTDPRQQLLVVKHVFSEMDKIKLQTLKKDFGTEVTTDIDNILSVAPYTSSDEEINKAIKSAIALIEGFSPKKGRKVVLNTLTSEEKANYYQLKRGFESGQFGDGLGRMRKRGKGGRFISKR